MNQYLDIPGNEEAISRLKSVLKKENKSKKVVAFVGAGASCEIYPSWGQLSDSLIDFTLRRGICTPHTAKHWASEIERHQDRTTAQIKKTLPTSLYYEFIQQSFSPEGKEAYTELHCLIQDLPLKAFVTTNYDSCALNVASRKHEIHITPAVWNDRESMFPWIQSDLKSSPLPILHAHGIWTHPESIVLSKDEYSIAYQNKDLKRVLENLWIQDTFLFIGFSFADKWIEFLSSEILAQHPMLPAKHFAFIGLDEKKDFYTPEIRMLFIDQFRIEPIFYYYKDEDHSNLKNIIMDLIGIKSDYLLKRTEGIATSVQYSENNLAETKNQKKLHGFKSIAVSSGKGGVGKTIIAINLALALKNLGCRVLLIDADLGMANVDVMLGLSPRYTLNDVFENRISMGDILIDGPLGIKIIPSASGVRKIANLTSSQLEVLFNGFKSIDKMFDITIIDTSSGIYQPVLDICRSVDEIFIIIRNEPTSITDAYGLIKVLSVKYKIHDIYILLNQTYTQREGREVFYNINRVAERFLGCRLIYAGCIPNDDYVRSAIKSQSAVLEAYPKCKASLGFNFLANDIIYRDLPHGGEGCLSNFLKKFKAKV